MMTPGTRRYFKSIDECETTIINDAEYIKQLLQKRRALNKLDFVICDDDPVDIEVFTKACCELNVSYRTTQNIADCMAEIERNDIGVLILDYNIGNDTAFDILDKMDDSTKYPIIIYSGIDLPPSTLRILNQRNIIVYNKDIDPRCLIKVMKQYIL